MQFNRSQLLAKIDEYYVAEAARRADKVGRVQDIWDEHVDHEVAKRPAQLGILYEMVQALDKPGAIPFTVKDVTNALGEFTFHSEPEYMGALHKRMNAANGNMGWPRRRPTDVDEAEILQGLRSGGRFEPLRRMLQTATDDTVSLSALQRLGVMSTEDSRILWGL